MNLSVPVTRTSMPDACTSRTRVPHTWSSSTTKSASTAPRLLRHGREVEPVPVLVTPVRHGDDLDALVDHVVECGGLDQILVRRRYLPDVRSPLRLRVPQLRDGGEAEVVEDDTGPTAEVEAGSKDAERLTRGEAEGDLAQARVDELGERGAQLFVPGDPRIPR